MNVFGRRPHVTSINILWAMTHIKWLQMKCGSPESIPRSKQLLTAPKVLPEDRLQGHAASL